jgi:hypothetical protein
MASESLQTILPALHKPDKQLFAKPVSWPTAEPPSYAAATGNS